MAVDTLPSSGKGVGDRVFGRYGVATVVMEILLVVGGFKVDRGAEFTLVNVNINIQESDMGLRGVWVKWTEYRLLSFLKEDNEGVWTIWSK